MKSIQYILFLVLGAVMISSCEKKSSPAGLPEFENHYYAVYVPNNNAQTNVKRVDAPLLKFPVQFYSTFTRDYDAVAYYGVSSVQMTEKINNVDTPIPFAVLGTDFAIVDKNGNAIQPNDAAGNYYKVFPKAVQATDTIYVKVLNNGATGGRGVIIEIRENKNDQFYVDKFSTACLRPISIK